MKIINSFYDVSNDKSINTRITVLSDIHYFKKKNMKKLIKIYADLLQNHPSIICIPGDLFDKRYIKDEKDIIMWLQNLSILAPVIISLGNHEFYNNKKDYKVYNYKLFNQISNINNVYVLDNQSVLINNINFIGLTLPGEYYYKYHEKNKKYLIEYINRNIRVTNEYYNILLCHSPLELFVESVFKKLNISKSIDLVICGHTHGGVTPNILKKFLKGRGLYSPQNKIFSKLCYGHYKINNTDCVISSGITKFSYSNRIGMFDFIFSKEVVYIDLYTK